ncbi:hypothetical protein J4423_00305 [Candidatus Pacearchaeota archaeon]|nr:hypothetical protein [Candidatus Pacearchaeota archaeon]
MDNLKFNFSSRYFIPIFGVKDYVCDVSKYYSQLSSRGLSADDLANEFSWKGCEHDLKETLYFAYQTIVAVASSVFIAKGLEALTS